MRETPVHAPFPTMRHFRFIGICLSAVLAGVGCSPPHDAPILQKTLRFVDPDLRRLVAIDFGRGQVSERIASPATPVDTTGYPLATINNDTRYVLAAPARSLLALRHNVQVPSSGQIKLTPGYPRGVRYADRGLIVPKVKIDGKWVRLDSLIVQPKESNGHQLLEVELTLPAEAIGKKVRIHIELYPIDWGRTQTYTTPAFSVGNSTYFEFAVGILDIAQHMGPVRFAAEWCVEGGCSTLLDKVLAPTLDKSTEWLSDRVALSQFAGQTGHLVLKSQVQNPDSAFSFPVWANPTIVSGDDPQPGPYNVILISIDTQRADHLTPYGSRHDTSPFIQRLADRGIIFDNLVAGASSTSPSHMTMFTGMQASSHGLTKGLESLAPWIPTMTEEIRRKGYETGAVTEDGWLGIKHGFGRGFNVYVENRSPNIMAPTGQIDATFGRAEAWLERHRDRRFFLFLHTFQVHDPFSPPAEYQHMFPEYDGVAVTDDSPWYLKWLRAYDQEIRYMDAELEKLFDKLTALGLEDETYVFLTSDHGENFMEHGYFGHGAHLHQPVTHVPLIVTGPTTPRSKRVAEVVGHVDLAPTILDLMGVEMSSPVQGRSLAGYLRGDTVTTVAERTYFSESWSRTTMSAPKTLIRFGRPAFAVRRGNRTLARYNGEQGVYYEAYDLAADPGEKTNLWPSRSADFADLRPLLDDYEDTMTAFRVAVQNNSSSPINESAPKKVSLDPEQEEKLRALGYLN